MEIWLGIEVQTNFVVVRTKGIAIVEQVLRYTNYSLTVVTK